MVIVNDVLADGLWVMPLKSCPVELRWIAASHAKPEMLGRNRIGCLVYVYAEVNVVTRYTSRLKEP
jgi:hypothetical protein